MRYSMVLVLALSFLSSASCSRSDGGRVRTIRESLDLWVFSEIGTMIFDSVPLEDMRGVHLAGAGLLNRDVLVSGTVEALAGEGTYLVLIDSSARMLVDITRVSAAEGSAIARQGRQIVVHGEVKSGEKGHIYLLANAVHGG